MIDQGFVCFIVSAEQHLNKLIIYDLMDQYVSSLGQADQIIARITSVTGKDNRSVSCIKTKSKGWINRTMVDQSGSDRNLFVLIDRNRFHVGPWCGIQGFSSILVYRVVRSGQRRDIDFIDID